MLGDEPQLSASGAEHLMRTVRRVECAEDRQ
jgi:hypothetical protein